MLRHQDGLELVDQMLDRRQVSRLGRGPSSERRADPVEAHRKRLANSPQLGQARAARHHVVLGMDFEPQGGLVTRERAFDIGLLEADTGADQAGGVHRVRPIRG